MIDLGKMPIADFRVIYNFKNVVVVGNPDRYAKLAEEISIKNMYVVGEK